MKRHKELIFNGSSSKLAYLIVICFSLEVVGALICCVLFVYNEIALPICISTLIAQYPISMRFIFKSFLMYKNERLKIKKGVEEEMGIRTPNKPNTNINKPNTNINQPNTNINQPNQPKEEKK